MPDGHLCGPNTSVPGKTECYEALWSQGRACKRCKHPTCYRKGWEKWRVDADNKALVEKNNA